MMIPRGECTFETKVYNAQLLGASGVIIYGTLGSRYSLNKTKYINDTNWNGQGQRAQQTHDEISHHRSICPSFDMPIKSSARLVLPCAINTKAAKN